MLATLHRHSRAAKPEPEIRQLGIRPNLGQFLVQTLLVFFVGTTVGVERTVVPLLAGQEFAIGSASVVASFVVSFGFVKAALNLWGGYWSERWGRKPLLVAGWVAALPIPLLIIFAPSWHWVVAANVLMGINQGLAWSMTVTSKVDIVGTRRRGLAIGLNEFAGYLGVAVAGWLTGLLASEYGLRPAPFLLGLGIILLALVVSVFVVQETKGYARAEAAEASESVAPSGGPDFITVLRIVSWEDRTLFACAQAGLVGKFVDALVWVGFPLYFSTRGLGTATIGAIVGLYALSWATVQLVAGPASDRLGRKPLIFGGMILAGVGVALTATVSNAVAWAATAVLTGTGIAMSYPTLLAAVSDRVHPGWRGAGLGVYRMWRDAGYGFGALLIGAVTDAISLEFAFYAISAAMMASGLIVALVMRETVPTKWGST